MKISEKLIEMMVSSIIKKGVLMENKNVNINAEIPNGEKTIKINVKCDNVIIKVQDDK